MLRRLAICFLFAIAANSLFATHWMGGEITWECQGGGDYIFKLKIYRDCNGVAGPSTAQLSVWNHPSITAIPLNIVSQTDISPLCTQVAGGPASISCGAGGAGAVEEFVFQSGAINIPGTPPAEGWVFTWDGFSRNMAINNLTNPSSFGITLRAIMYAYNGQNASPCFDSSPQFAELPATVLCTGYPFRYNQNAFDPDLDSLAYSFGQPLDDLNGQFNPGVDPAFVPFETGYSVNSPLPGTTQNANNVPADINPYTGEITFTSFTQGNFVIVVKVESWRCGQKIAEVYREIQTVLLSCGVNNPPVITPPFPGGLYADTVWAGDLVTFSFASNDPEQLQDGSPQTNILVPSGSQFGANFNDPNSGCPNPPCATLSDPIPLSGANGINTTFTWQTDCSHVGTGLGCNSSSNTHTFVFKVTDDFCPAPGVSMPTVSITVRGLPSLPAPDLRCASVLPNGDVDITWIPPNDPQNSFDSYEIWSSTSMAGPFALVGTVNNIATTTFTHVGADAQQGSRYYYVKTISGCGAANESNPSDTLQTIFLDLLSVNGVAQLSWNPIAAPNVPTSTGWYEIYLEYPVGTWTLMDSIAYGSESFDHVIDICDDTLTYIVQIADSSGCVSVSSTAGDWFTDVTSPELPEIHYVTVDTITGLTNIVWQQNPSPDTQGYIIMQYINGNWVPIDTVWGITDTTYIDPVADPSGASINYGILAFDSCWSGTPPSPNTSALGSNHETMFLQTSLDICERSIDLTWTPYTASDTQVDHYEIYLSINGGNFVYIDQVGAGMTTYLHENANPFQYYCYIIEAHFVNEPWLSHSNRSCLAITQPPGPTFNYLQAASVEGQNEVDLRIHTDLNAEVMAYVIERSTEDIGPFEEIASVSPSGSNPELYTDLTPETSEQPYYYRVLVLDSCGDTSMYSNQAKTILLSAYADPDLLANVISWTAYQGFDGQIIEYNLYRGIDGVFDPTPLATLPPNMRVFQDDVSDMVADVSGEFCYYVEAVEDTNSYNIAEVVSSNIDCAYQDPKFFIPSAFIYNSPIEQNRIFKPVVGYIDFASYEFYVYNRWGEAIFYTTDVNQGWNGLMDGYPVQEGVYIYHFIFNNAEGATVERRGPVTFLIGGEN